MNSWIRMISDSEADDDLRNALECARTPHGTVDNVLRVHSLRPDTMRAHMALYRAVLHDDRSSLPTSLLELIGTYVSILNGCSYSFANHWANARHLMDPTRDFEEMEQALMSQRPEVAFSGTEAALLRYAEKLTCRPAEMAESDITTLRHAGLDDAEILEANQVIGYFNYVNRSINGLGVGLGDDVVGYYDSPD